MLLTAWIVIWNDIMLGMAFFATLMIAVALFAHDGKSDCDKRSAQSAFLLCVLLILLWLAGYGAGVLVCEW